MLGCIISAVYEYPTDISKATAVSVTTPCNAVGTVRMKNAPVFVVVITPVGVDAAKTAQRPPTHAANRHDGLDQRNESCHDQRVVQPLPLYLRKQTGKACLPAYFVFCMQNIQSVIF